MGRLWRTGSFGYAFIGWVFPFGFYDRVMNVLWLDSTLNDFYRKIMELIGL